MSQAHRNNFDFFRLMAAISVWYSHCFSLMKQADPLSRLSSFESFGSLGVTIFFIISGYFVTMSYENNQSILRYAKNRFLRIFPALCAVVLASVFILGPLVTSLSLHDYFTHSQTWRYLRSLLIFPLQYELPGVFPNNTVTTINGSLWTLQHEVRLYGVIALLGVLGILRPRLMWGILLGLYAIRLYGAFFHLHLNDRLLTRKWGDLEMAVRLASQFMAGSLLYLARERLALRKDYFALAMLACIASPFLPVIYGRLLFDLAFAYAVIYLGFLKLPLLPAASRWGDFSYGFYLYAYPMQQLSLHLLGNNPNFAVFLYASFMATLLCAILSWQLVEKPALRLKS